MSSQLITTFFVSFGVGHLLLGMLWYSKYIFGTTFNKLNGHNESRKMNKIKMWISIIVPSILSVGTAFILHYVLLAGVSFLFQFSSIAVLGIVVIMWLAFSAIPALTHQLHSQKSWKLFLINNGFNLAYFVLFGVIWFIWNDWFIKHQG